MNSVGNFLESAIWIIGILVVYQIGFRFLGFLFKAKRYKPTEKQFKYAVMIAARNEDKVIAQLVASIKKQNYPADLITIFVVADNCTDNTADVAREAGAVVYERVNPPPKLRKKGCALDFLVRNIEKDYGVANFDGFFIFDADNLLSPSYITEMNKAFANPAFDFWNSYINVKNFGTSFISSFSSITLYADTFGSMRPMSLLGLSKRKRGTGCLVRSHFLNNGYPWQNMCEDKQFTISAVSRGYRSQYVEAAEFFDEQPQNFRVIMRQRMRWAKGNFLLFCRCVPRLLVALVLPYDFRRKRKSGEKRAKFNPITEIQKRLSVYETLFSIVPTSILTFIYGIAFPVAEIICGLCIPAYTVNLMPTLLYYIGVYAMLLLSFFLTVVREHKKMRINPWKLLLFLPFWPLISITVEYASLWAIITPLPWRPIPHYENKEIENIYDEKTLAERLYQKQSTGV